MQELCSQARGTITCADAQLPIAPDLDDSAILAEVGGLTKTPLRESISQTAGVFRQLLSEGRLELSNLTP